MYFTNLNLWFNYKLLTFTLKLQEDFLYFQIENSKNNNNDLIVKYQDILAMQIQQQQKNNKQFKLSLNIQVYAVNQKTQLRTDNIIQIKENSYDLLNKIKNSILENHCQFILRQQDNGKNNLKNKLELIKSKKILIFVNPISGKGTALKISEKAIQVLEEFKQQCTLVKTLYYGFVYDFIKDQTVQELVEYDCIVCVSGDGLPHELINALKEKEYFWRNKLDSQLIEKLNQIKVCQVSGGTANSLLFNICHLQNEKSNFNHSLYYVVKGIPRNMDLMEIHYDNSDKKSLAIIENITDLSINNNQNITSNNTINNINNNINNNKKIYSFLSITYGIVADIDLESEKIRFMGPLRFDIYGLIRFLNLRTYKGILYYSTDPQEELPDLSISLENNQKFTKVEGNFIYFTVSKLPFISPDVNISPNYQLNDGMFDISYFLEVDGRWKLLKLMLSLDSKGSQVKYLNYVRASAFRFQPLKENHKKTNGFYSIDGEKYQGNIIQASLLKNGFKTYAPF